MAKLRFSLSTLMILMAASSVACAVVFALLPLVWDFFTETNFGRRVFGGCIAFVILLVPALLLRLAMVRRLGNQ